MFAPLVWLAIFQIFILAMLASSPRLHAAVHSETHDPDHHCLATDFKSGLIEQAVTVPILAPSFVPVFCEMLVRVVDAGHRLPHHLCGSLLEHGPPAVA